MPVKNEIFLNVALTELNDDYDLEKEVYRIFSRVLNSLTDQVAQSSEFDRLGSDELATVVQNGLEKFTDQETHRALAKAILEARIQRPAKLK